MQRKERQENARHDPRNSAASRAGCRRRLWGEALDKALAKLIFNVNYLGGNMPTFALNFSRPGGQIVAQYYNFLRLGKEGYRKIQKAGYDTAMCLAAAIGKMGPFEILYNGDPRQGIPALSWKLKEGVDHGFTLFELADRLRTRGWLVPAYTMSAKRQDMVVHRILVKHGFSRDLASLLLRDYDDAVAHCARHPVTTPLSEQEAGSFKH